MTRVTRRPKAAAHCGECWHPLVGELGQAFCVNKHCPQVDMDFTLGVSRPQTAPVPEREVA